VKKGRKAELETEEKRRHGELCRIKGEETWRREVHVWV
jgi:hypothetical protein